MKKEYNPKKRICIYTPNFQMPEGEEICVLFADDCANVELPSGKIFHTCDDIMLVRVMKAKHEKDVGTWCYGKYGGRLFI